MKFTVFFALAPPKITKAPSKVETSVGEDVHITCHFIGKPVPTVTWYCGEQTIVPNEHYQIDTVSDCTTLTIKRPEINESTNYTLLLENPVGKTSHFVTLDVLGN